MKRDYEFLTVLGVGGINEQDGLADPIRELGAARNVWAPDGHIESRPGYRGVLAYHPTPASGVVSGSVAVYQETSGVMTATGTLSGLPAASGLLASFSNRWYVGVNSSDVGDGTVTDRYRPKAHIGVLLTMTNLNTNAIVARLDYWNGSNWIPLQFQERYSAASTGPFYQSVKHLGGDTNILVGFPWPQDIAKRVMSVDATARYWLRFTLLRASRNGSAVDTTLATPTVITSAALAYTDLTAGAPTVLRHALCIAQFPAVKRYVWLYPYQASGAINFEVVNSGAFFNPTSSEVLRPTGILYNNDEPASFAIVPQFNELYVSYNYNVTVHKAYPTATDTITPVVESDPAFVGPDADYNPNEVSQAGTWPQAKYITFFRGEFWAANLKDGGYSIRWSAPSPAYKVWPTLNEEILMEDDNSPITGLCGYDQYMIVFKEDSVWRMVDTGISDFSLQTYAPERVVAGVGCVCNGSVQQIRGRLVFLAEDGVYAYDGTPNIVKLSDRVRKTIASINPAQRASATSANWATKSLYLLAVAANGAAYNNIVLVWDYKNDAWWVWDNMEAQQFFKDEGSDDNERVYFATRFGQIYELGCGNTDNGAIITAYYETQRLAESPFSRKLREVEVQGTNLDQRITVKVLADDEGEVEGASGILAFTDTAEKGYGTATYGTDEYGGARSRVKRLGFLRAARSFKIRLTHAVRALWKVHRVSVGIITMGRRR